MLTIREFNAAHDRHLRRVMWLFLVFLTCLLNAWMWDFDLVDWVHTHVNASIPSSAAYVGAMIAPIALLLLVGMLLVRWAHRDPRLRCPNCDKGLVRHRFRVVATRRCPMCACDILTDPKLQHPATLARTEVEAAARRHLRRGVAVVAGVFVFSLLTIGISYGAFWLYRAGWIGEPLSIGVACVSLAVMLGWAVWGLIQYARMFREREFCPRCQAGIFPEQIARWGSCGWCGQRLIADPLQELPDGGRT